MYIRHPIIYAHTHTRTHAHSQRTCTIGDACEMDDMARLARMLIFTSCSAYSLSARARLKTCMRKLSNARSSSSCRLLMASWALCKQVPKAGKSGGDTWSGGGACSFELATLGRCSLGVRGRGVGSGGELGSFAGALPPTGSGSGGLGREGRRYGLGLDIATCSELVLFPFS